MAAVAAPFRISTPSAAGDNITQPSWSPYDDNGGTAVAVAGDGYCIVAASTRLSTGYSILTRESSKLATIAPGVVIATAGMQADSRTLHKTLSAQALQYQFAHRKPINVGAAAQMLSNMLYYKRFFPYYTANLCCGLAPDGKGAVYTYDGIGSHERVGYSCQGSGSNLIQPVLDNQLAAESKLALPPREWITALPMERALDLVKNAFVSAGERDIYTGDAVEIQIITKEGVKKEILPLKKD
mmetsp:Transcript_21061/g.63384  ORF Transcript_21061/g.63384 Transcript_21061/m.63384 type:complete len:241 (-) Transcript_21061:490-1212(-)|eukprot:CAMPEP_0206144938 /NCGR_PEP_ID=MMETSP1473-20131121/25915_1 /ASSEMBLY_ACC=CAM_ASM_001109 /TAXON_ID=1461547 /ORGANISM="Stichococcus sp, Strain RCC1054" /LENGTH=240 /DNA_ID=CAMNT_0053540965 /DNA_START=189 /DNA_END=911 /DNA_ORIENTATION=-